MKHQAYYDAVPSITQTVYWPGGEAIERFVVAEPMKIHMDTPLCRAVSSLNSAPIPTTSQCQWLPQRVWGLKQETGVVDHRASDPGQDAIQAVPGPSCR